MQCCGVVNKISLLQKQNKTTPPKNSYRCGGQRQSGGQNGSSINTRSHDCQATYIGETTRNLTVYVQLTEHNQVTRNTVF